MTHTTTVVADVNSGSYRKIVADLDITSLDNADSEDFSPASELGVGEVLNVSVGQVESAGTYVFSAEQNNNIHVEAYGGTDPTAGTDVGVVRVSVEADPAP